MIEDLAQNILPGLNESEIEDKLGKRRDRRGLFYCIGRGRISSNSIYSFEIRIVLDSNGVYKGYKIASRS